MLRPPTRADLRDRERAEELRGAGWCALVLGRAERALRRAGLPMRRVGEVWYAPDWALQLAEAPLGAAHEREPLLRDAVDRILRGLDPGAALAALALGGPGGLRALLDSGEVLALPPRPEKRALPRPRRRG